MSFSRLLRNSVKVFPRKCFISQLQGAETGGGIHLNLPVDSRALSPVLSRSFGGQTHLNPLCNKKPNDNAAIDSLSSFESFDEIGSHIFDLLQVDGKVSISQFLKNIASTGIRQSDPRLKQTIERLTHHVASSTGIIAGEPTGFVDRDTFLKAISGNMEVVSRAFRNDFIIPDFNEFTETVTHIYENCKLNTNGVVASYIPQLGRISPNLWGVSVCTIDGQRFSIGDCKAPFTIQSTSKPLSYAIAYDELGGDIVHKYVGQEPSGRRFNEISLNPDKKPHNPLVNAGAILVLSLIKPNLSLADRFDFMQKQFEKIAGYEYIGFNNSAFLSERQTADRNFALAYFMRENKCFPPNTDLKETMDLYFQMCAVESHCEAGAVVAATLANGGYCPTTGDRVINPEAVRDTLSLMYSCGMYDYSGQFAFQVGLPAKSGVSGAVLVVIPNVAGFCLYSPCLDINGNSVRGIQFCQELVTYYNFHNYDNLRYSRRKKDPRKSTRSQKSYEIVSLLYSAYHGDETALRRFSIRGTDMNLADYDGRTALHLSCAEGNLKCVEFLVEKCHANLDRRDRWGFTALDDAQREGHTEIVAYLNQKKAQAEAKKADPTQKASQPAETTQPIQSTVAAAGTKPECNPKQDKDDAI